MFAYLARAGKNGYHAVYTYFYPETNIQNEELDASPNDLVAVTEPATVNDLNTESEDDIFEDARSQLDDDHYQLDEINTDPTPPAVGDNSIDGEESPSPLSEQDRAETPIMPAEEGLDLHHLAQAPVIEDEEEIEQRISLFSRTLGVISRLYYASYHYFYPLPIAAPAPIDAAELDAHLTITPHRATNSLKDGGNLELEPNSDTPAEEEVVQPSALSTTIGWLRSKWPTIQISWPFIKWAPTQPHLDEPRLIVPAALAHHLPRQITASQENIYRLLQDKRLLQQLLHSGFLTINALPSSAPTAQPVFRVQLLSYSTLATLVEHAGSEPTFKMGDIEIPLQTIEQALLHAADNLDMDELPSDSLFVAPYPPFSAILAGEEEADEEEEYSIDATDDDNTLPLLSYEDHLAELNRNIQNLANPEIKQKTIAVRNKISALHQMGQDPKSLTQDLELTNRLLMAKPGEERQAITALYQQRAKNAQNSHSPALQALGIAMMLLGAAIAAISALFLINPATIGNGVAGVMGAATLLATGIGLFAYGRTRADDATTLMTHLGENMNKTTDDLFTNATQP